jgi:peroxiredoxin
MTDEQKTTTELLAVSADDTSLLQIMVDRVTEENDGKLIDYTLLTDEGGGVINRYGLFNTITQDLPIPHPTTYVIDREGVIRWKMTEVNYRIRPENADILAALEEIDG